MIELHCSDCGYGNDRLALHCAMCGRVFRRGLALPAAQAVPRRRDETRRLTAYPPALAAFETARRDPVARHGWVLVALGLLSVGTGLFLSGMTAAGHFRSPLVLLGQYASGLAFGLLGIGAILGRNRLAVGAGFCLMLADTAIFAYAAASSPIPHLLVGPILVRIGFLCYWIRG